MEVEVRRRRYRGIRRGGEEVHEETKRNQIAASAEAYTELAVGLRVSERISKQCQETRTGRVSATIGPRNPPPSLNYISVAFQTFCKYRYLCPNRIHRVRHERGERGTRVKILVK